MVFQILVNCTLHLAQDSWTQTLELSNNEVAGVDLPDIIEDVLLVGTKCCCQLVKFVALLAGEKLFTRTNDFNPLVVAF